MEFSNEINMEISPFATLEGHSLGVSSIHYNPINDREFLSSSHDEHILIWDIDSKTVKKDISLKGG